MSQLGSYAAECSQSGWILAEHERERLAALREGKAFADDGYLR